MGRNGIRMDTLFFVGKTTSGNHHVGASRAIGLVKERENAMGAMCLFPFSSVWRTKAFETPINLGSLGWVRFYYFVCAIINKHYTMCHILNIFKMKSTYLTLATFKHLSNAPRCFTRCAIYTEIMCRFMPQNGFVCEKPTPMFSHHFRL